MPASKERIEWKELIKSCLDSTLVGVLATRDGSDAWATPVYFSYDEKFNLYFISPRDTRHMRNIKSHPSVAIAVVTPQSLSGIHQVGVQIEGAASEVPDKDIERVYRTRAKRMSPGQEYVHIRSEGHFVKEYGGVFMCITPKSIFYIDTRTFGGSPKSVPLDALFE